MPEQEKNATSAVDITAASVTDGGSGRVLLIPCGHTYNTFYIILHAGYN